MRRVLHLHLITTECDVKGTEREQERDRSGPIPEFSRVCCSFPLGSDPPFFSLWLSLPSVLVCGDGPCHWGLSGRCQRFKPCPKMVDVRCFRDVRFGLRRLPSCLAPPPSLQSQFSLFSPSGLFPEQAVQLSLCATCFTLQHCAPCPSRGGDLRV